MLEINGEYICQILMVRKLGETTNLITVIKAANRSGIPLSYCDNPDVKSFILLLQKEGVLPTNYGHRHISPDDGDDLYDDLEHSVGADFLRRTDKGFQVTSRGSALVSGMLLGDEEKVMFGLGALLTEYSQRPLLENLKSRVC